MSWTFVTGWVATNTFAWTPATANALYRVGVWVSSNGVTADLPEAAQSAQFAIAGNAVTEVDDRRSTIR